VAHDVWSKAIDELIEARLIHDVELLEPHGSREVLGVAR
jgi:hypothetical protein